MVERKTLRKIVGIFSIVAGALGITDSMKSYVEFGKEYFRRNETPIVEENKPTPTEINYLKNSVIVFIPSVISLSAGIMYLDKLKREK
ncbi:MAG: hypothetical protein Q7S06_01740 [Nanoarchaeota archaeon]|nr:hypothetical protein [Nanoarchaeota archaeon]